MSQPVLSGDGAFNALDVEFEPERSRTYIKSIRDQARRGRGGSDNGGRMGTFAHPGDPTPRSGFPCHSGAT